MKSEALALSLIMALVCNCLFYGILVQPVESQSFETIYIRDDGSVDGTNLIERHDNTYIFLNNISGSIVISKDFITIDGSGFALIGTDESSQKGINLSNRKNVTVTNMVIMNYHIGIVGASTTSNITILNNHISSCEIGIEFLGSSNTNNLIKYSTFKNNDIDITMHHVLGNNAITQNSLNNYVQVWMSEQQTIDMNFWANYNGADSDGDGIGDSPYFYNGILQDNQPLMKPVTELPSSYPSPSPTPAPTQQQTLEPTQSPAPEPEPFPTTLVIAVVVAVAFVCVGLFVYFKKRKRSTNGNSA